VVTPFGVLKCDRVPQPRRLTTFSCKTARFSVTTLQVILAELARSKDDDDINKSQSGRHILHLQWKFAIAF